MGREQLGVVALQEAEVIDFLLDLPSEERPARDAEGASERIPARDLDAREHELGELRPEPPPALGPDRAQDRLHVARRAADELAPHQLPVGDDGHGVLADGLAVAADALVGVDGEEDEVRAELRSARPVELLGERNRERRRLDGGDLHHSPFNP